MPALTRFTSALFRIAEIAFGAIVAGIIGRFLDEFGRTASDWAKTRWIYTEVIAGVSILFALIWVVPVSESFFAWPLDILLSFAWFAAFGILVNAIQRLDCGNIWYWGDFAITNDDFCGRWKAAEAFSFLSAIVWLASAFVGIWFTLWIREPIRIRHRSWTGRPYV